MSTERYVLAIDLGTSGPKVGLVSTSGKVAAWAFESVPIILTEDGGVEQDPEAWWQAVAGAGRQAVEQGSVDPKDIVAVGVTAQWSGTVAVANGRHLGNAIIWMDARGAAEMEGLNGGPIAVSGYSVPKAFRWIRRTGGANSSR